jgi:hypothetical protein
MMMGTPGRPGTTISKPPPANADAGSPIRKAASADARMRGSHLSGDNLPDGDAERVKALSPIAGKPNV